MGRRRATRQSLACWALLLVSSLAVLPSWAGSVSVTTTSAFAGTYGLEVVVGDECTVDDTLALTAQPPQIEGIFEACLDLSAENLEVFGSGTTFRSGEVISLGEAFSVALGGDFTAVIDTALSSDFDSVEDPSPIAETAYHARLFVRLDDLTLGTDDEIEHFAAYSGSGESQFVLTLRKDPGGVDAVHLSARQDGGGVVAMTPGQELPLTPGWNKIEIDWSADPGNGAFLVEVNDGGFSGLTGLTNGGASIESARWGAIGGSVESTSGTLHIDGFDSWR
ncbi:MAG: hypothetical protein OES47_06585, partial [Acidobacteriota bacterium]|nr:hypothetical protein [Acidobacteriota bacterium]